MWHLFDNDDMQIVGEHFGQVALKIHDAEKEVKYFSDDKKIMQYKQVFFNSFNMSIKEQSYTHILV